VYIKHPKARLLIVGDGSILNDLKRQASGLGIENAVIFTGKIGHQHVFNYISVMDICIMAKSNWYGSPVKLFEYGLMRKPIIAPDTSPVKDVMIHEKDALIISDNENALADAIEILIDRPEKGDAMAQSFYTKVMTSYNWEHAANNIIKQCK
jgi:glycosyltransferase involved in cell wall biosynthesis